MLSSPHSTKYLFLITEEETLHKDSQSNNYNSNPLNLPPAPTETNKQKTPVVLYSI